LNISGQKTLARSAKEDWEAHPGGGTPANRRSPPGL